MFEEFCNYQCFASGMMDPDPGPVLDPDPT